MGRPSVLTSLVSDAEVLTIDKMCLAAGATFVTVATCLGGMGRHVKDVDGDAISAALLHGNTISAVFTIAASVWSKVSFALSLLRISSSGCTEITRRTIWGIIITLNIMLMVATTMLLVSCTPIEKIWKPELDGTCWSRETRILGAIIVAGTALLSSCVSTPDSQMTLDRLSIFRRCRLGVGISSLENHMVSSNSDSREACSGVGNESRCFVSNPPPIRAMPRLTQANVSAAAASFVKCAQIGVVITEDFTCTCTNRFTVLMRSLARH